MKAARATSACRDARWKACRLKSLPPLCSDLPAARCLQLMCGVRCLGEPSQNKGRASGPQPADAVSPRWCFSCAFSCLRRRLTAVLRVVFKPSTRFILRFFFSSNEKNAYFRMLFLGTLAIASLSLLASLSGFIEVSVFVLCD